MRHLAMAITLALLVAIPAVAQLEDKVADRFWESTKILEQTVNAPDGGIPQELLGRSECVAVIPAVKRAAFGFGGRYGRGVVACRMDGGSGAWGAPSMISLSGGSFGFQIGGQSTDVLMLFLSPDSMEHLLADKLTLGADASAAIGPKGRTVSADTSATMRAEILTYARSRGLFAGISVRRCGHQTGQRCQHGSLRKEGGRQRPAPGGTDVRSRAGPAVHRYVDQGCGPR